MINAANQEREAELSRLNPIIQVILKDNSLSKPMRYNTANQKFGPLYSFI